MKMGLFQTGFDAVTKMEEVSKVSKGGSGIYDFYVKDGEEGLMRFLTFKPLAFKAHTIKVGKAPKVFVCTEDEHCMGCHQPDSFDPSKPNKATIKGAFLVLDGREIERDEMVDGKPTGKKIKYTDQVRVMVRGVNDIAVIQKQAEKYGLDKRTFVCSKSGQKNPYTFDRQDDCPDGKNPLLWSQEPLSEEAIEMIREKLPEKYKDMSFEEILMEQFKPYGETGVVEEPVGLARLL